MMQIISFFHLLEDYTVQVHQGIDGILVHIHVKEEQGSIRQKVQVHGSTKSRFNRCDGPYTVYRGLLKYFIENTCMSISVNACLHLLFLF